MEKRMNIYINELCGTDMEILQDIVTTKYKQFKSFYRAVESVSDDIDHVSYGITNDDVLSVKLYLTSGSDIDAVSKEIKEIVSGRKYNLRLKTKASENVIVISVSRDK